MCAILLSAALVKATPARVKCAVRRAVKVIHRRAREHAKEKTIHTYIHVNIHIADFHYLLMLTRFTLSLITLYIDEWRTTILFASIKGVSLYNP